MVKPDNKGLIFPNNDEQEPSSLIFLYDKKETKLIFVGLAEVESCNEAGCFAKIKKIRKNIKVSENLIFSTVEYKKERKVGIQKVYGSLGGPFGVAYNLSYFNQIGKKNSIGGRLGVVSNTIGKIKLNGIYFNLQQEFELWKNWNLEFNPFFELGYFTGSVDFAELQGPKFKDSAPYLVLGINVWKNWQKAFIVGKLGYSYNFLESTYDAGGDKYNVSFAGSLMVAELGIGLTF